MRVSEAGFSLMLSLFALGSLQVVSSEPDFAEKHLKPLIYGVRTSSISKRLHCAMRHNFTDHYQRPIEPPRHDIAVVLSACKNKLSALSTLRCTVNGKKLWYFVYKRCKEVPKNYPRSELDTLKSCATIVDAFGASHPSVLAHYALSPHSVAANRTLFVAPGVSEGRNKSELVSIPFLLTEAANSPLDFQSYGGSRSQISGSTAAEVCYALQRYTCLPACTVEGMEAVVRQQQFKAEPKEVSYLVSLYRLWSLRAHEYQWLQTWSLRVNQAWANSLWTYVWGCPQDSHSKKRVGCAAGTTFESGHSSSPFQLSDLTSAKVQPKPWRVLPEECVRRHHDASSSRRRRLDPGTDSTPAFAASGNAPRLGVVVVLCSESLATFRQLECDPENPATVLHVYSKCGKTEEEVRGQLGKMAACVRTFRTVETTLATEVAWPKHHAEYLEHIISNYGQLETAVLFLKANFPARNLDLTYMVSDASSQRWEFKSFGLPKVAVDLSAFPENGNEPIWQAEMCALYRRYHCLDVCAAERMGATDPRAHALEPLIYNTRSMWAATADRIRSLPRSEYQWWREFIHAPSALDGVKRRYMMERLWQAMLGCPQEHIHPDTTADFGCVRGQSHPSGSAVAPPPVLLSEKVVSWPQPVVAEFNPAVPYPLFNATYDSSVPSPVSFVFAVVGEGRERVLQQQAIQQTAVAAFKLHPGSRMVILVSDDAEADPVWESDFWMGRLQVVRPHAPRVLTHEGFFSKMAGYLLHRRPQSRALQGTRLSLENAFLEMLAADPSSAKQYGHLVFMDGYALPLSSLEDAFVPVNTNRKRRLTETPACTSELGCHTVRNPSSVGQFVAVGIPYGNIEDDPLSAGTWYVAKTATTEAAAFSRVALQLGADSEDAGKAMARVMACCSRKSGWWKLKTKLSLTCDLSSCGVRMAPGATLKVNLLPCHTWAAALYGDRVEACPVKGLQTNVLHFPATNAGRRALKDASFRLKDKSSKGQTIKNAILKFLTEVRVDRAPAGVVQSYLDLFASRAMSKVWMPVEKQGVPVVGAAVGKTTNDQL